MSDSQKMQFQEGAITLLDILGWKGIWKREQDPLGLLQGVIDFFESHLDSLLSEQNKIYPYGNIEWRLISISDWIAFVTFGSFGQMIDLHGAFCSTIIRNLLYRNLPVRGATTYGLANN